jgi:hypothetical protein
MLNFAVAMSVYMLYILSNYIFFTTANVIPKGFKKKKKKICYTMVNYANSKIYQIVPLDGENGDVYIGATTKQYLSQRMQAHRDAYKQWKTGKGSNVSSYRIFDKYGVENCSILLLEEVNAASKDELSAREGYYIRTMQCLNKVIMGRTPAEYYLKNSDKISEQRREYYLKNTDKLNECNREYRLKNSDKISEQKREYYLKNTDKVNECNREYRLNNKEKTDEYQHQYRLENADKAAEYLRQYRLKNADKVKEYNREYYLKKKAEKNTITA